MTALTSPLQQVNASVPDATGNGHAATSEKPLLPVESFDDPTRLAKLYLAKGCERSDGLTLRYWREQWCRWDGTAYKVLPDSELRAHLQQVIHAEFVRIHLLQLKAWQVKPEGRKPTVRKITKALISNTELALASLTVLAATVEQPSWWDGSGWTKRNLIALQNGLFDLDAFFARQAEILLPHTPRWFSATCLPYPFDVDADCPPKWRVVLSRNLEGDGERSAVLQEWFGLSTTADTTRQKFLALVGEGGNGKGVICAVMEAMIGKENCSHVPLEVFGERFQLTASIGKLINICSEVGELDKVAEGFLKSFTAAGVPMQFDRKFKPPMQAVPTARLVLCTNNLPRFSDRSGGLWRRMILMPLNVVIADDDPSRIFGMDESDWWVKSGEMPGIFNWALAGLDRLRNQNQGRFTKSKVCEEALAQYRLENNPARLFLTETCEISSDGHEPCGSLYQSYRRWCQDSGYAPLADRAFGKEVKRAFPNARRRQAGPRGSRFWVYAGIVRQGEGT